MLEQHVRLHYGPNIRLTKSFGAIAGLETYSLLRDMYDCYWTWQDDTLNTNAPALTLGPAEPTTALARPRQTLNAPSPITHVSATDYLPLGSTALARRAHPDAMSNRSTTAAFEAQVDTYLKKSSPWNFKRSGQRRLQR